MKTAHALLALALGFGLLVASEAPARACGGCFHPPTETPSVVTDHRMVFAVSAGQATLYDQIKYTGSPSSFAWVLPFVGDIEVGVSSDALFQSLDQQTQTVIQAPPLSCPQATDCGDDDDTFATGGPTSDTRPVGVEVLKQEVIGPFETVQLKATDPNALTDWLAKNGFNIPPDVQPVIAQYQAEHFNFLALKLAPGKGIQAMRPVRVTTKGSSVALPLRMVAAGTGATVGITLWVVGEGRYQPQSFPTFHIEDSEIAWDGDAQKSDYIDLRAQKTAAGNDAIWEVESSIVLGRASVLRGLAASDDPDHGYLAEDQQTPTEVETTDLDHLFTGIDSSRVRVTRLRADLSHAALNRDFVMEATPDQGVLSNVRRTSKYSVEPLCAVYDGCEQVGTARLSKAIAKTNENNEGCATSPRARSVWLEIVLAGAILVMGRKMRRGKMR